MNCYKCSTEMDGANCMKCGGPMECNGDCKCNGCDRSVKKEEASCDSCMAKMKEKEGGK